MSNESLTGLKVEVRLWSLEKYEAEQPWTAEEVKLWIKGTAKPLNRELRGVGETMFNGPGELLTKLGQWNWELRKSRRRAARG